MIRLDCSADRFRLREPFTISRGSVEHVDVVTVVLTDGHLKGWGECRPYPRYEETVDSVRLQIEQLRGKIEAGLDLDSLPSRLAHGAARNALDCALWDLKAKRLNQPVWSLAGLPEPQPARLTYTISLASPETMASQAKKAARSLLKLKLGGAGDLERMQAVREAVPDAELIVDANEAWDISFLDTNMKAMADLGIQLIEQPLPVGQDRELKNLDRLVPLCADESCHTSADLAHLKGLYDFVNIKLDKTGGLTDAISLAQQASASGFGIMLGCMMASSLSMAPASLLSSYARFVDLDAPLLLAEDREHAIQISGETMSPPARELWG